MDSSESYLIYVARENNFNGKNWVSALHDFNGKNWILALHLIMGKQAKGKASYLKDAIMLPTINCDVMKAATNVTVDYSFFHKKWQKYLVILKDFLKILQDTVVEQNLNLITKYCYFKMKMSHYKTLLLISVSRCYLQDTKTR